MAVTGTLTALSTSIKIAYSDEFMEAHQNQNAPFLKKIETSTKGLRQDGKSFDWEFALQSPQAIGTPNDGAAVPTTRARVSAAATVNVGQFVGTFDISWLVEAVATPSGSWNGGEPKRSIKECVSDVTKHMNRIYAGTHGTGRLAQVESATSSSTSFVAKLPVGVLHLRPNMLISIYDDDTGSGGAEDASELISKIVASTRTVTVGNAQTLDANDHVYLAGSYGGTRVPNGIRGLVDDGTYLTTVHGVSRSTYEELKSTVLGASGVKRDLTEDLLIDLAHGVRQKSGQNIDLLVMNWGQLAKFYKHVRADRRLNVSGAEVPSYNVGYKKLPTFFVGGQEVEILASEDVVPREVYGITTGQFRRVVAKKLGWKDWGGTIFQQAVDTTYTTASQATLYALENIATYMPAAHGRIEDLYDPQLCGASVGGPDV